MRFTTAFLDRDRTLTASIPEGEYVTSVEQVALMDGVGHAVRRLNDAGIATVVVTNQRAIALGLLSETDFLAITAEFDRQLAEFGAYVDWHYHCPHDNNVCECRKPKPGLILRAFAEHPELNRDQSIIVGDKPADINAGIAADISTVLVDPLGQWDVTADARVDSFPAAVNWILAHNDTEPSEAIATSLL